MPKKPVFTLPKMIARAITYLLIFTSFWYFDSFLGCLNSVAQAQSKPPAAAAVTPPVVFRVPQSTLPISLIKISSGFNNIIGMDYAPVQDKILVSVNWGGGQPNNFDLVDHDGNHSQYTNVAGLGDEVYIATARDTQGGFNVGDAFTGNGVGGQIMKISADGQTITNPWVKLPNEIGLLRGGLHVDQTGVWGGDLIVVTTGGGVWRINSQGQPQVLAQLGDLVEGPDTIPNDPVKYGPWAGRIVTGSESSGKIYAIDTQGNVRVDTIGIFTEAVHLIPPNQNFFAACFGAGTIVGAPASAFTPYVGQVLFHEEGSGNVYAVRWDGSAFQKTLIAKAPNQLEGSCFAPAGIVEVPPVNPPPTITLSPPQTIQATSSQGASAGITAQAASVGCTVLQITWTVDGFPVERVDTFAATGSPPSSGTAAYSRLYAPGSHTITGTVTDSTGQKAVAQTTVTVLSQTPIKTLTGITVTPNPSQLNIGQTVQLTATGTYSDNSTADLTQQVAWMSASPGIATPNTTGLVTGVFPGTATISASLGSITGTAQVTVVKSLVGIAVTPQAPQLGIGQTVSLTATGSYNDGSTADITALVNWSSGTSSVATVNAAGVATGVAVGTSTVTASLSGISGSTKVTVFRSLVSIAVTPANPQIFVNGTEPFIATGTYNDGFVQDLSTVVIWASSAPGIATVNGVGQATGVTPGTSTISATNGGITGSTILTVVLPPPPTVSATITTGILWPPDHDLIDVGLSVSASSSADPSPKIAVSVYSDEPENATTGDGQFSPDARIFPITGPGTMPLLLRRERKGNNDGRVYLIIVTATDMFGQTSFAAQTAVVPHSMGQNDLQTIQAEAAQALASAGPKGSPVTPYQMGLGPNIGPKQGPGLAAILLTPTSIHLPKGGQKQFTATGFSGAGSIVPLGTPPSWSSSKSGVSTVNSSGLATGQGFGSSIITASSSGFSGTAPLIVDPPSPTSLVVYPAIATLFQGTTWNYQALAFNADGTYQDVTSQVVWSSSVPADATVNSAGLVTTVAGGPSTITATFGALSGTGTLGVIAKVPTELNLFMPKLTLVVGQQEQPALEAHMNDCSVLQITTPNAATWSSSNTAVAGVYNGVGYIITAGTGTTTISAQYGGLTGTATLTVIARQVVSIAPQPVNYFLLAGRSLQYSALAFWNDGSESFLAGTDVQWTTAGAPCTITASGLLTAQGPGLVYVRATQNAVSGFTILTVQPITLNQITVSPPYYTHVTAGLTQQYTATGSYSDGTTKDISSQVTWSMYYPQFAQIDASGLLTAYSAGANYVVATLAGTIGYSYVIIDPPALTSISVTPPNAQLIVGQLGQYAAMGNYTDGSTQNLTSTATWSSDTPGVATVNSSGVVTAVAIGTATITAVQGGFTGSTTLTVAAVSVSSIAYTATNPQIVAGKTFQLQLIGTLNNGSTQDVTSQAAWTTNAASVATVSPTGVVTAVGAGQATITATLGSLVLNTTVTVTAQPKTLTSLTLTPAGKQLVVGQTQQYGLQAGYSDGSSADVTSQATWASLVPAVATVNASGVALGVGVGTTQIQATFNGITVGQNLQVISAPKTLTSVAVLPGSATLSGGQAGQFLAQATYSDGTKLDITTQANWVSSNPAVATIGASTGIATALTAGGTTITATFGGFTGFASLSVTVQTKTLSSIALIPSSPQLPAGQTGQFTAVGTYSDGSTGDLTITATWASSAPSIATISPSGLATALTLGTTTIMATSGGVSGSTVLTVVASAPPPAASIPSPAPDSTITLPTPLVGTASSPNFASYKLEYAPQGSSQFIKFGGGTTPVTNGTLGTFDPTLLKNGIYTVRLTVTDSSNQSSQASAQYIVDGFAKIGNFSLTFTDLNIPVAGIPVTVNRVYDSRDRGPGDFGNGWNLSLRTLNIQENTPPGQGGWQVVPLQGGIIPSYQLISTSPHYITVTLPSGRTETFDVTPSSDPSTDQNIFPSPTFTPRAGSTSTLKPLSADPEVIIVGDSLEDFSFQTFEPLIYQLRTLDGTTYTFGLRFGMSQVKDTNGNTITISPTGITSSGGPSVAFARDGQNRITKITDPMSQVLRYAYDPSGNLISSTDRAGNVTTYTYSQPGLLQDIFDPLGRHPIRNDYDDQGRLIDTIDASGNKIAYSHLPSTQQEIVTDRNGNQTLIQYDTRGRVVSATDALGGTTLSTYDENDNLTSVTDPVGTTTSFSYDSQRNLLSRSVLANGTPITSSFTYNSLGKALTMTDPLGNVITNVYDANGNLTSTADPLGNQIQATYDASGNVTAAVDAIGTRTELDHDGAGRILAMRVRTSTGTLLRQSSYAYDGNGNRTSAVDYNGNAVGSFTSVTSTSKTYDANGRVLSATDPLGHISYSTYDAAGQVATTTDKNGNTTTYVYNDLGLLTTTQYAAIQVGIKSVTPSVTVGYDANGNRVSMTDRNGNTTQTQFDSLNRPIQVTHPDGTLLKTVYDAVGRVITETNELGFAFQYAYDALGRRTSETDPLGNATQYVYDAAGQRVATIDALGRKTQFAYDSAGRQTSITLPDGTSRTMAFDAAGRKVQETDEVGIPTRFVYSPTGQLLQVQQTDPSNPTALTVVTQYAYDDLGNKIQQTDALGRVTSFTYSARNELLTITRPLGQVETYTYDGQGNLASRVDGLGQRTLFQFNALNLLTSKLFSDGSSQSFTYYPGGQRSSATSTTSLGASTVTTYGLDVRNRLISQSNPDGTQVVWGYDGAGNRTLLQTPSQTLNFTYTPRNELLQVFRNGGSTPWATYGYDGVGNRSSLAYANGTQASYGYDSRNHLVSIQNLAGTTVTSSYTYGLDPRGLRTSVVEDTGRTVSYAYDNLRRLTRESVVDSGQTTSTAYSLDSVGNRLQKSMMSASAPAQTTTYDYDANDELLSESGPDGLVQYQYDANGQTTGKVSSAGSTTYSWDFEGRMIGSSSANQSVLFGYDVDGVRTSRSVNGTVTEFVVDNNRDLSQVIEEHDGSGATQVTYAYGDDLLSQERSTGISFYHYDGQSSVRQLTSSLGQVSDTYSYDAFGVTLARTGTTPNAYLYGAQQFDAALGLYYLRARYYGASGGRFLSQDSFDGIASDPITLHRYLYASVNPSNHSDPSGQSDIGEVMIALAISTVISAIVGAAIGAIRNGAEGAARGLLYGAMTGFLVGLLVVGGAAGITAAFGGLVTFSQAAVLFNIAVLGPVSAYSAASSYNSAKTEGERTAASIEIGLLIAALFAGAFGGGGPRYRSEDPNGSALEDQYGEYLVEKLGVDIVKNRNSTDPNVKTPDFRVPFTNQRYELYADLDTTTPIGNVLSSIASKGQQAPVIIVRIPPGSVITKADVASIPRRLFSPRNPSKSVQRVIVLREGADGQPIQELDATRP